MPRVTAEDGRLTKPLQSGNRLVVAGLLIVLVALVLNPANRLTWAVNLVGVVVTTWGAVRVSTWIARLRGRRSLTENAIGVGLVGAAAAMTITAAQGPQDRENTWILGISAVSFAILGLALMITSLFDHRGEQRMIDNPAPPPGEGAITRPQHPGYPLRQVELQFLRLSVGVSSACYVAIVAIAFLR